jgi:hypothetical protein
MTRISIPVDQYDNMMASSLLLDALLTNGVDNWEGYHHAVRHYEKATHKPTVAPPDDWDAGLTGND